ncbi:MAG: bifunctional diaminohydroxyphosphoribosylaminopyrimidine deaminase/5-amino-6-(5-phosphoribosylamino)uracil reductase RibD [Bacteroidota bacterium]|nr:bifunctional diaminohydroxyphosphoribosylaminopyrimidine deaminase/5-amino-6-(5-phosphoribosylamino)uracil reductase RibD [Bacteroidota bacterium]
MSIITEDDRRYMLRCFDLAQRGIGQVSPNPPVGAVLVFEGRIIGEGYHQRFGGPHAEVEAINNVTPEDRHLIPHSILYVSLEPCCMAGKTPPCTDLILHEGVKDVRFSTVDPNPLISGRSVTLLENAGVTVTYRILEEKGKYLIRAFATNILSTRPYVVLKWAQSKYGYVGQINKRILISHPYTSTWSHRLRAEADAIIVGARTIKSDNPHLTTRNTPGRSPHRVIYDPNGSLDKSYNAFQASEESVFYFSTEENQSIEGSQITKWILPEESPHIDFMLEKLFQQKLGIILVEGGSHLLNMFINADKWDEAWIIQSPHALNEGVQAPNLRGLKIDNFRIETDTVIGIRRDSTIK